MSLAKNRSIKKAISKRSESTAVIVTKTFTTGTADFEKKVKAMNALISKSKLLSK